MSLSRVSFNDVLGVHAIGAGICGVVLVVMPHRVFGQVMGEYNHTTHEFARCYGALTLAQAWLTLRTRRIADARVRRILAESYTVAYTVTAVALGRATYTAPSILGFLAVLFTGALGIGYAYFRFVRKLKSFQLPGTLDDDDDD